MYMGQISSNLLKKGQIWVSLERSFCPAEVEHTEIMPILVKGDYLKSGRIRPMLVTAVYSQHKSLKKG